MVISRHIAAAPSTTRYVPDWPAVVGGPRLSSPCHPRHPRPTSSVQRPTSNVVLLHRGARHTTSPTSRARRLSKKTILYCPPARIVPPARTPPQPRICVWSCLSVQVGSCGLKLAVPRLESFYPAVVCGELSTKATSDSSWPGPPVGPSRKTCLASGEWSLPYPLASRVQQSTSCHPVSRSGPPRHDRFCVGKLR